MQTQPTAQDILTALNYEPTMKAWRKVLLADPCAYCGTEPSREVDHITPTAAKSNDSHANLTGSCRRCNRRKKSRTLLDFMLGQPVGHNPEYRIRGIHYDKTFVPA